MFIEKFVKGFLFIYFLFMATVVPVFDEQLLFPIRFFPDIVVDVLSNYAHENNDFLMLEKSDWFIGLMWHEFLVQWPLCIANLYGLLTSKSWLKTTCLIYGVSTYTLMVPIVSELIWSPKSSPKLLCMHGPYMLYALVPIIYGLAPHSNSVTRASMATKKGV